MYRLGFYAQDEWRVAHDLKLTLALRADHASNPVCQHNCFARTVQPFPSLNHDVNIPYNQAIQVGQRQEFTGMTNLAWQPRLGFAWQPFGSRHNLVVRGGIGLFYDGIPGVTVESIAGRILLIRTRLYPTFNNISPAESSNIFADAANSNTAFLNAFANGGTLGSILESCAGTFRRLTLQARTQSMRLPQYQEWNLEIQKGFGQNTILSLNYVGNHGIHEMVPNASINGYADSFAGMPATPPDPEVRKRDYLESAGVSSYNGVTAQLPAQLFAWHGHRQLHVRPRAGYPLKRREHAAVYLQHQREHDLPAKPVQHQRPTMATPITTIAIT